MPDTRYDFLIVGAGILGLSVAKAIKSRNKDLKILIVEKEKKEAKHSSGRNSGVLHAGFYYGADSLKTKFTRDGNKALSLYCETNSLPINKCGKVVVAKNENEVCGIEELYARGIANSVNVKIVNEKELSDIEPNAKTVSKALYSPDTATVDPILICSFIKRELEKNGVGFIFGNGYAKKTKFGVMLRDGTEIQADIIINCAGLYADKIAKEFGFAKKYTIIPFKGLYLKYVNKDKPIKMNIYPVPNLKNPFLGVHYTVTVDGNIKIGPTAIPAFWRENYGGFSSFSLSEALHIFSYEAKLFLKNSFGFRDLALEEIAKYDRNKFVSLAASLVNNIDFSGFKEWSEPGIRAQLLNKETLELVQDFVVEGDDKSVHILNAVSPAFTSSLPFGEWIVENYIRPLVIAEPDIKQAPL